MKISLVYTESSKKAFLFLSVCSIILIIESVSLPCLQFENGSDSQSTTSSATSSDVPRGATTTEGAKGEGGKGDGGGGGKIKKKFRKGKQDKKSKDSSSHVSSTFEKKNKSERCSI